MRKGSALALVIWVVILAVLAYAAYYIWTNYSKIPNESTKKAAKSIIKYPSAKTWEEEQVKNLCLSPKACSQPIKISFETPGNWGDIYAYYNSFFNTRGWSTNTTVVTSIPTSVVYKKDFCESVMENHSDINYSFTVVCTK